MKDGADDMQAYFEACQRHPLLTPKQESELAKDFEDRERHLWVALFSFEPAFPVVCKVITDRRFREFSLPGLTKIKQAFSTQRRRPKPYAEAVWTTACRLRKNDDDRVVSKAALGAVTETFRRGPKGSKAYLDTVRAANGAQQELKDKFISSNLRLVVSLARPWAKASMPLADIVQEGTFGLIKAVERFDHTRGFRFSTYASWWIKHAINRGLADRGRLIRIPGHLLDTQHKIARAECQLRAKNGSATTEEIAELSQVRATKVATMYENACLAEPFSLEHRRNADDRPLSEILVHPGEDYEDVMYSAEWRAAIADLIRTKLTDIEATVVRWRFGFETEERTLQQIGDAYGLSRERIRQLQEDALTKLRAELEHTPFGQGMTLTPTRIRPRITREHWRRTEV